MAAREAVLARRAATAAGAASPAQAAAAAVQRVDPATAAAAAARSAGSGPTPGSQAWVDEWAPAAAAAAGVGRGRQQQQRRGGRGGRGGRRGRGRGRLGGRQAAAADEGEAGEAEDIAAALSTSLALMPQPVDEELDPLPGGLEACSWDTVAATTLPAVGATCIVCFDTLSEPLESGEQRLVVQLRCRHTFCALCLRQYNTDRNFKRLPVVCPTCRGPCVPP